MPGPSSTEAPPSTQRDVRTSSMHHNGSGPRRASYSESAKNVVAGAAAGAAAALEARSQVRRRFSQIYYKEGEGTNATTTSKTKHAAEFAAALLSTHGLGGLNVHKAMDKYRSDSARVKLDTSGNEENKDPSKWKLRVEEAPTDVGHFHTPYTVFGSIITYVALILFAQAILGDFWAPRTIESILSEEPSCTTAEECRSEAAQVPLPPVALSFSQDRYTTLGHPNFLNETQWLDYFWPLFRISGTVYGMNDLYNTSYKENKKATDDEFLQPKFGDACRDLDPGGMMSNQGWLVWCLPGDAKHEKDFNTTRNDHWDGLWKKGDPLSVMGRYGDPVYQYLKVFLVRCGHDYKFDWRVDWPELGDMWSGKCANDTEFEAAIDSKLYMNIWFDFSYAPENRWNSDLDPEKEESLADEFGIAKGWSWYAYQSGIELGVTAPYLEMHLRDNEAKVFSGTGFEDIRGVNNKKDKLHWWDFSFLERSSDSFSHDYLEIVFRPDWQSRLWTVRYQTLQDVLTQVSGSYTVCWTIGFLVAALWKYSLPASLGGAASCASPGDAEPEQVAWTLQSSYVDNSERSDDDAPAPVEVVATEPLEDDATGAVSNPGATPCVRPPPPPPPPAADPVDDDATAAAAADNALEVRGFWSF